MTENPRVRWRPGMARGLLDGRNSMTLKLPLKAWTCVAAAVLFTIACSAPTDGLGSGRTASDPTPEKATLASRGVAHSQTAHRSIHGSPHLDKFGPRSFSPVTSAGTKSPEVQPQGEFHTAPHPPLGHIPTWGGPILTHPHLVTITFPGAPQDAMTQSFGDYIVGSPWLAQVGADYGVGLGQHTHVQLSDQLSTVVDHDMEALLTERIQDGTLPGPLTTSPTQYLYMVFLPPQTSTWVGLGPMPGGEDALCFEIGGELQPALAWHSVAINVDASFVYAIIPTCNADLSPEVIANIETFASHEFIEAATDPWAGEGYILPFQDVPWALSPSGEVGDMCEYFAPVAAGSHTFTQVWSNSAAAAGEPPCIPVQPTPYYNVGVRGPQPQSQTQLVTPGQTLTFDVVGWSTAPTPAWPLSVFTYDGFGHGDPVVSPASTTISNGQHVTLTVTVPAIAQPNDLYDINLISGAPTSEGIYGTLGEALMPLPQLQVADPNGVPVAPPTPQFESFYPLGLIAPTTTSDGFALYSPNGFQIYAVQPGSRDLAFVSPGLEMSFPVVQISGRSAALWPVPSGGPSQLQNQLQHWSHATGFQVLSRTSVAGLFAESPSGNKIFFTDNFDGISTADLVVANADGSDAIHVLTGTSLSCLVASFAGDTLVAQSCPPAGSGSSATLSVFAPPAYGERDVATGVLPMPTLLLDQAGTRAFVTTADATSTGSVVSLETGAASPIGSGVMPWYLSRDGQSVLYATPGGALVRSSVSPATPVTLVASGAGGLLAVSPDERAVAYYSALPPSLSGTDLYVALTTPGSPATALATASARFLGFTNDSQHVVYLTGITGVFPPFATMQAAPIGGPGVFVAADVPDPYQVGINTFFGPGSLVLTAAEVGEGGIASLLAIDLSGPGPVIRLDQGEVTETFDPSTVQFLYTKDMPVTGLYTSPSRETR